MYSLYDIEGNLIISLEKFSHAELYARRTSRLVDYGVVAMHINGREGPVAYFVRGRKLKTMSAVSSR